MLRPHSSCRTLGSCDFIRVPSPAARTITAAGRLTLTPLRLFGYDADDQAGTGQRPVARFTHPTPAGYPQVAWRRAAPGNGLPGEDSNLGSQDQNLMSCQARRPGMVRHGSTPHPTECSSPLRGVSATVRRAETRDALLNGGTPPTAWRNLRASLVQPTPA